MQVGFDLVAAGHCVAPESMLLPRSSKKSIFKDKWLQLPSLVGIIRHSKHGVILVDTGYELGEYERCIKEAGLAGFLYRNMIKVQINANEAIHVQLKQLFNITAEEVSHVIITHFHCDHVCGLKQFPNAKYVVMKQGYEHLMKMSKFDAARHAFFPSMLPADFSSRMIALSDDEIDLHDSSPPLIDISNDYGPFQKAWDLFQDGSVLVVSLPGHCHGQLGVLVPQCLPSSTLDKTMGVFMVGDSCWHSGNFQLNESPHWLSFLMVHTDDHIYKRTLKQLHDLYNASADRLLIIPAHCPLVLEKFVELKSSSELIH